MVQGVSEMENSLRTSSKLLFKKTKKMVDLKIKETPIWNNGIPQNKKKKIDQKKGKQKKIKPPKYNRRLSWAWKALIRRLKLQRANILLEETEIMFLWKN